MLCVPPRAVIFVSSPSRAKFKAHNACHLGVRKLLCCVNMLFAMRLVSSSNFSFFMMPASQFADSLFDKIAGLRSYPGFPSCSAFCSRGTELTTPTPTVVIDRYLNCALYAWESRISEELQGHNCASLRRNAILLSHC